MNYEIKGNPSFGHIDFDLSPGEKLLVESGAMSHMTKTLTLKTRLMGGVMRALVRRVLGGESFFIGEYTANDPSQLAISPGIPGQVGHMKLSPGQEFFFQGGSFLACTSGVDMKPVFGGLRSFFSREGVVFLKFSGKGDLFYNSYGGIVEHQVDGKFVVDTGHVVGWEPSLNWKIRGMGGLKSTLFSGEGLVIEFEGRGKLLTQTRSEGGLVGWISRYCY